MILKEAYQNQTRRHTDIEQPWTILTAFYMPQKLPVYLFMVIHLNEMTERILDVIHLTIRQKLSMQNTI